MLSKSKYFILLAAIISALISCSKGKDDSPDNPTNPDIERKVDNIDLSPYKFARGYDTTDNYIAHYLFKYNYNTQGSFVATSNPVDQKYTIKYVGEAPLISPDSLIYNNGELMVFPINPVLKGKTVFEVYNVADNKLFRKITASSDSCKVIASFSVWANNSITPAQIRAAFGYYMATKQTPAIKYY